MDNASQKFIATLAHVLDVIVMDYGRTSRKRSLRDENFSKISDREDLSNASHAHNCARS